MTLCPRCSFTLDGPLHRDWCSDAPQPSAVRRATGGTPMFRYTVTIPARRGQLTSSDIAGLLDMLRHDAAVVVEWDHATPAASSTLSPGVGERWDVVLRSERPPTVGRWRSFGIACSEGERV